MATVNQSAIRSLLRRLKTTTHGDILGSALVSTDGYLMASDIREFIDDDRFSSMCASLLALADHLLNEVDIGVMQQVMIMGSDGFSVLTYAGPDAVLALSASPKAMQGRVLMESKRTAGEIAALLAG
ncbi:roadblock/LC7 domain-containing protein [Oceanobacter mangrovi]|uniref:roadblock/LC7 domain-containing protein n=1 Tax=Oceanobacter mangrovi TaxID=2862510 RepID=UPI001C8DAC6E|nr:roadblock/LC7 domain-containing protein [Oceanobacter mangrovi]